MRLKYTGTHWHTHKHTNKHTHTHTNIHVLHTYKNISSKCFFLRLLNYSFDAGPGVLLKTSCPFTVIILTIEKYPTSVLSTSKLMNHN